MQGPAGEDLAATPGDDVPENVRFAFWLLVVLLNLSIFAFALGVMLVGFRGQWSTGGGLALVGTAGLATAYLRYRTVRRKLDRGELTDYGVDSKTDADTAPGDDSN